MTFTAYPRAGPEFMGRWRRQIACRIGHRKARGARPMVAIGTLVRGPIQDGLIDVRRLLFVVLHDQSARQDTLAIRLAGYKASGIPWGVSIGGAEQIRFEKDLLRAHGHGVSRGRIDLADRDLLTLALNLDRYLERHLAYPRLPRRRQPRWPQLWAAFEPEAAARLRGAGPEWETVARGMDISGETLMACRRTAFGLVVFPLEFVSHAWQQFVTVFADIERFPKRQVLSLDHDCGNLVGCSGAIEFDLLSPRFSRATPGARLRSPAVFHRAVVA